MFACQPVVLRESTKKQCPKDSREVKRYLIPEGMGENLLPSTLNSKSKSRKRQAGWVPHKRGLRVGTLTFPHVPDRRISLCVIPSEVRDHGSIYASPRALRTSGPEVSLVMLRRSARPKEEPAKTGPTVVILLSFIYNPRSRLEDSMKVEIVHCPT